MKSLLILSATLTLCLLTSCTFVRFATVDHGQIVDQSKRPLDIEGRPRMTCINSKKQVVADGYFVFQKDDGSFVIDEFGKRYVTVKNPVCLLGSNERPQD